MKSLFFYEYLFIYLTTKKLSVLIKEARNIVIYSCGPAVNLWEASTNF